MILDFHETLEGRSADEYLQIQTRDFFISIVNVKIRQMFIIYIIGWSGAFIPIMTYETESVFSETAARAEQNAF